MDKKIGRIWIAFYNKNYRYNFQKFHTIDSTKVFIVLLFKKN